MEWKSLCSWNHPLSGCDQKDEMSNIMTRIESENEAEIFPPLSFSFVAEDKESEGGRKMLKASGDEREWKWETGANVSRSWIKVIITRASHSFKHSISFFPFHLIAPLHSFSLSLSLSLCL